MNAAGANPLLWLWGLLVLALLTLTVVAIIWLIRHMLTDDRRKPGEREQAEDVLRRRYAAGEIDQEDYRRRLHDLRGAE